MRPVVNTLFLQNVPILEQLKLEEALLRTSTENYCLVNSGSTPAIVMGISGKEEELIEKSKWREDPVPIIRRFSGGGTVVVDENTLFVTFLFNSEKTVPCRTDTVHQYLAQFWQKVFHPQPFQLIENDYVLGAKKMGGNAQYLTKDRWLHHTSFLWDFCPKKMGLLSHPKKTPSYRAGRPHLDFLTKLSSCFTSQTEFLEKIYETLSNEFSLNELSLEKCSHFLNIPHRKQTFLIEKRMQTAFL